jgi:hypothetical protein
VRKITWARSHLGGYEVSSKGDGRFSALNALMPDNRTIEQWYQCDVKGYEPGGIDWKQGKGKPALIPYKGDSQWQMYLGLWRVWSIHNSELVISLFQKLAKHEDTLTDQFATSDINQARAMATIINEWILERND